MSFIMSMNMLDGKTVKRIRVVPYSHHDYAWVNNRIWHQQRYVRSMTEAVDMLYENPKFTWIIDNVTHSWKPFEKANPEVAKDYKKFIDEGRVTLASGGYSLARPSYVGEESYLRNLLAGKKYFKDFFGIDKMPTLYNADTACGHSQLPQIAKLSGHNYYRFQRCDLMLTKRNIPFQFNWKGLDGSELLISRGFYGSLWAENEWLKLDFDKEWDKVKEGFSFWLADKLVEALPVEDLILFLGSDDCLPLKDAAGKDLNFDAFMAAWNEREPVKMAYASMDEYYADLSAQDLPTVSGVLDHSELSYNLPIKGDKSMWRLRHELDKQIVRLEKTSVIAESLGLAYPEKEINDLWYALFEITGHAIEWIMRDDTDNLYTIAEAARLRAVVMTREAEDYITAVLPMDAPVQTVVFNTLNWEVNNTVEFKVTTDDGISGFDLFDQDGNQLDYQLIDMQGGYAVHEGAEHVLVEVAVNVTVPPMGYAIVKAVPNGKLLKDTAELHFIDTLPSGLPADNRGVVALNNGKFKASFYKGILTSFENLASGKKVEAKIDAPLALLKFREYEPTITWVSSFEIKNEFDFIPTGYKLLKNGPVSFEYKVWGEIAGNQTEMTYSLQKGKSALNLHVKTNFTKEVEGMLSFAVAADIKDDIFADIPFGTEKREFFDEFYRDEEGNFVNPAPQENDFPGQFYARNWTSFNCQGVPLSIVTQNCSVYYNRELKDGVIELILNRNMLLKHRTDRWVAKGDESYNGLGINNFNFSLMLNNQLGRFADIQRYHKESIFPLSAVNRVGLFTKSADVKSSSLLSTDKPNIIATAFYKENGSYLARFFECEGEKTDVIVSVPKEVKSVSAVDLEGNMTSVEVEFNTDTKEAKIVFEPFKIITLKLGL